MRIQEAALHHFGDEALVEARGVQVGGLLGLQQLGVDVLGRNDETEAQARCQHLGERTHVDAAFGIAGGELLGRLDVEPQIAVGVVFHQRNAQFLRLGDQCRAARFGHRAAGGVLEVGQQVHEARLVRARAGLGGEVFDEGAFVIAGDGHHVRLHRRERLQRAEVGGRFDQDAAARVDHDLADQVERLLRAGGDQDLVGAHVPGQEVGDRLTQRDIAFAGGVLQGRGTVVVQDGGSGFGELADREGLGRGQATREADDAGLLGHFENFTDHRGVHFFGASGQSPLSHVACFLH